ncbi:MAG TPA: single-stranded-DNA-specific exonuclease RecJ [Tepidisphaeraceae bacterium]|jgi:single-stranded-DNA-specific exonuclease|nr:single-stranded-DNA-specific exonuclease RecJ [Tepidisphaeraceae bacterium]
MRQSKRWNIAEEDSAGAAALAAQLKTSSIVGQILLNRGMRDLLDCRNFLRPSLKCLHDPATLPGLTHAAERIAKAIADQRKIVIYGDYDVDGITAVAILWHAIRQLGGVVDYYIPHRLEEGYGLNAEAIEQICKQGAGLILTVDCGITAVIPARVAADHGVDLIITDHHEWHETQPERSPILPACYGIVHPRLPGQHPAYPNPHLCGAGVAFKLAWGIGLAVSGANRCDENFRDFLVEATALAALGTIADVVPLVGENRILAHYGLGGLKASKLTGIKALIDSAQLTGKNLDSFHVGFLLAPRLNACGRMGHARLAVEMLTGADQAKAVEIATFLEQQNRARQAVEKKILEQAIQQVADGDHAADGKCAMVLGAEGWHPGVIGIVASRMVERFHRPTLMIGLNDGHGQGSGRSIAGFHLAHALEACGEFLEGYGGHEMAAGLKMRTDRLDDFRHAFCAHAANVMAPQLLTPELKVDCIADLSQINAGLVTDLARLGPFGHANRRPLLVCRNVTVATSPRRVGKTGDHLQLLIRQGERTIKCIAFGFGDEIGRLKQGVILDLAVEPTLNEFNGRTSVELEVKDMLIA